MSVETHLDSLYKDAELRFDCEFIGKEGAEARLELKDKERRNVQLPQSRFKLAKGKNTFLLPVANPLKWDAEHPNLYTLEVAVYRDTLMRRE